jgi:hypothetical protein
VSLRETEQTGRDAELRPPGEEDRANTMKATYNRHVVHDDVELLRSLRQIPLDHSADLSGGSAFALTNATRTKKKRDK